MLHIRCFCLNNSRELIMSWRNRRGAKAWNAQGISKKRNESELPKPPPGLKGRALGLFYRDRQKNKKLNGPVPPRELMMTFQIPPSVENRVGNNLQNLYKMADKMKIILPRIKDMDTYLKIQDTSCKPDVINVKTDSDLDKTRIAKKIEVIDLTSPTDCSEEQHVFKKPKTESFSIDSNLSTETLKDKSVTKEKNDLDFSEEIAEEDIDFKKTEPEPGPSTSLDFIPIGKENPGNYKCDEVILPLRGKRSIAPPKAKPLPVKSYSLYGQGWSGGLANEGSQGKDSDDKQSVQGSDDYKYGYEDIITGTFDEKLDACLAKGIPIKHPENDLSLALYEDYKLMQENGTYKKMLEFRKTLPTYKKAEALLDVFEKNQVVVISGETGCGKSTQVPQIILDEAIRQKKGANVHIIVTQPRRIAASSLATRVAQERAEKLGVSVGYAVRLEKVEARARASITYCTTGVLLADLEVNQGLTNCSHIILDEVHERDCHIDLSMCMLKKLLQKRKDLKLLLMSATVDAETLSQYFESCPLIHIEGLAYPVQDVYLEDILLTTGYQLPPPKDNKRGQSRYQQKRYHGKKQGENMEKEIQYQAEISRWFDELLVKRPEMRQIRHSLLDPRIEDINVDLIVELLFYLSRGPPGAVLVFLPGIGNITKLITLMEKSQRFPQSNFEVYPLHSKLPSLEQHKIFERPPPHIRKIIIATNIAETSITVDDIVYVIDCARIKMSGLIVEENVSTLNIEWVSQTNLHQRRGRAGRCQPGICYHLLTSYRASTLQDRLLPELQRSDLLEPVLSTKRLRLGKAVDAMAIMPSPPAASTVEWAVKHLQQCGALNDKEILTPLGWHLARLPVHPSAGKLLLLGTLFGCLDRAASVAAVWGFKDPFQLVIGKEQEVDRIKRNFANGEPSDHVAMSEAILQWEKCPAHSRRKFSYDHFLSNNTVQLLSEMKNQLGDSLKHMGFLLSGNVRARWENRNNDNISLFKAIIAASLYPKVATVRWINAGVFSKKNKKPRIKVTIPTDLKKVNVHPSSVMAAGFFPGSDTVKLCNDSTANWLVYWLKQRTSDLFLIDVTLVYTLPVLFFGELAYKEDEQDKSMCQILVASVYVRCNKRTAKLLFELRALLDCVLASKVSTDQVERNNEFEEYVLNVVTELITAEDEGSELNGDDYHSESDASERE